MKKIITALLAAAVLVVASCVTTQEPAEPGGIVKEKTSVGQPASAEKEKTAVKETVYIPYVVKETAYFSDGYIESYKVFSFNEDMTPAREDFFDSFDEIIESRVYEALSASERKSTLYNARGQILSWHIDSFKPSGLPEKTETYSYEGELQTVSEFGYDEEGRKTSWLVFDGSGVKLSETRYIYDNGLNTGIEIYDAAMRLQEYFVIEYDGQNPVTRKHLDVDGNLQAAVEYTYSSGILVEEKSIRANGSVSGTVRYSNDEKGNPVRTEFFDGNGTLKGSTDTKYEYVKEEVTIWR